MFTTIVARFPGTCRRCRGTIAVGAKIRYSGSRGGTWHLAKNCAGASASADVAAERSAEYRMTAEYQQETQGYVSAP